MPTLEEARLYLGIDYADDVTDQNIERCLSTAGAILRGALGDEVDEYMCGDYRVRELQLIYMEDLYSQRGISAKVSNATRRMVSDMELQLRMELREMRGEA